MKRQDSTACRDLAERLDVKRSKEDSPYLSVSCVPVLIPESGELNEKKTQYSRTSSNLGCEKLDESFYDIPCEHLAQRLLGKILVRRLNGGTILKGRIVETECYLGGEDKASHSFNGRRTPRNTPMYMKPGTIYVYFTYGMYFCFNISSRGDGAAVLLRAVDPLEGLDFMNSARLNKRNSLKKTASAKSSTVVQSLKPFELCNGPGKLCISFCIDAETCNMQDLSTWDGLWIEDDGESGVAPNDIIISKRIGIDSVGGEWVDKPLRYYVFGNRSVSRRDRVKEKERLVYN